MIDKDAKREYHVVKIADLAKPIHLDFRKIAQNIDKPESQKSKVL